MRSRSAQVYAAHFCLATTCLVACATSSDTMPRPHAAVRGAPDPSDVPAVRIDDGMAAAFLAAAFTHDRAVNEAAWRCWNEARCVDGEAWVEEELAEHLRIATQIVRSDVVASRRGAGLPLRTRRAARVLLEHSTARTTAEADGRERQLLLHDAGGMPFVPDDLPVLLATSDGPARAPLLTVALPVVEERRLRLLSAAPQRAAAARAAGLTPDDLLAARAGIDSDALRALVDDVLRGTRPLLQRTPTRVSDLPALLASLEAVQAAASVAPMGSLQDSVPARVQPHAKAPGCAVIAPPNDVRLLEAVAAPPSLARYARAYCDAAKRLLEGAWDPLWLHTVAQLFASVPVNTGAKASIAAARSHRRAAYLLTLRGYALEISVLLRTSPPTSAAELDALVAPWDGGGAERVVGASALMPFEVSGLAVDLLVAEVVGAAIENTFLARFGEGWAHRPETSQAVEQELDLLASAWLRGGAIATLQALGLSHLDAGPLLRRWERL